MPGSTTTSDSKTGCDELARPLLGVRVIEFGHVAAGPYATSLLADLGADVVKVESPEGDQMRSWPPIATDGSESFSHNFASLNRNKRSVVADLKSAEGNALVQQLVQRADVIMENYRPGALDRLGFGFDDVSRDHRGLVYCSISGFGRTSPYASDGAYDVIIQAMGGLMSITGEPDGKPVKAGVPVADFLTGLYAAFTVASLLPRIRDSGRSVHVDCPMLDCLLGASALQTSEYWGSGREPRALGSAHPRNSPYQAYSARDREFVVAAGSHKLWKEVCEATGLESLVTDVRFRDQESRAANQLELTAILHERFVTRTAAEWISELRERGVPASLVNTYGEILADTHMEATGLVKEFTVPVAGATPLIVFPARIGDESGDVEYSSPPRLGEHTDEVIAEWSRP